MMQNRAKTWILYHSHRFPSLRSGENVHWSSSTTARVTNGAYATNRIARGPSGSVNAPRRTNPSPSRKEIKPVSGSYSAIGVEIEQAITKLLEEVDTQRQAIGGSDDHEDSILTVGGFARCRVEREVVAMLDTGIADDSIAAARDEVLLDFLRPGGKSGGCPARAAGWARWAVPPVTGVRGPESPASHHRAEYEA
jgi:hypothetical protein